ncbi:MAG: glycosyltransferase family 39 protein [Spirochaetes bacterium]|nr:glycosyltransferase family 39 protein [Spirochaetota bacterium]
MTAFINKISDMSPAKRAFLVCGIVLISFLLRIAFINSDPPEDLSFSAALYTDEGFKVFESRNHELFGSWKWTPEDEYSGWKNQSPLSVYSYAAVFELLGVSLFSVRILSVIYSVLTLLLFYLYIKKYYGTTSAVLASFLFGTNFFMIMYNRLGFYETHLNFYIMAGLLFLSMGFLTGSGSYSGFDNKERSITAKKLIIRIIFVIAGAASLAAACFIKKSVLLSIAAFLPGLLLIILDRQFNIDKKILKKIFTGILLLAVSVYLIFAHINIIENIFPGLLKGFSIRSLPIHEGINFAPLHIMLGKSLFLEAVFLQPLVFFTAVLFAFYSIFRYFNSDESNVTDFILSCWLLCSFLFLVLLKYNPARYYIIINIPLIILCTRFFFHLNSSTFKNFLLNGNGRLYGILKKATGMIASAYLVTVLFFNIIPFSYKKSLMQLVYKEAGAGFPHALRFLLTALLLVLTITVIYNLFRKKYFHKLIQNPGLAHILFTVIILFSFFQYGKWLLFHENKMYTVSKELACEIEPDAVIAGSWSAGLVLENKNPALILQRDLNYNQSLLNSIVRGNGIPVNLNTENRSSMRIRKNLPVYLALSPETVFEKPIYNRYRKYLHQGNLFKTIEFGYFDVKIYRIFENKQSIFAADKSRAQ